jgi:hypothetical protein
MTWPAAAAPPGSTKDPLMSTITCTLPRVEALCRPTLAMNSVPSAGVAAATMA